MVRGIRAGVNSGNYRHGAENSAGDRIFATECRPCEVPSFFRTNQEMVQFREVIAKHSIRKPYEEKSDQRAQKQSNQQP